MRTFTHCLCMLFLSPCMLFSAVDTSTDGDLLAAARASNTHYQNHRSTLLIQLQSTERSTRIAAIDQLSRLQEPTLIPVLAPFLDFNLYHHSVVSAACRGVARLGATNLGVELTSITTDPEAIHSRSSALVALAELKQLSSVHFTEQSHDLNAAIRASGITNLGTIQDGEAGPILADALLHDRRRHVRHMAAIGLGKLGDKAHGETLIQALSDGDPSVRRHAAASLATIDYKPAIPYLLIHLESNIAGKHLNTSLMTLSGQDFGYRAAGSLTARREAIQRGFTWYTKNASTLQE